MTRASQPRRPILANVLLVALAVGFGGCRSLGRQAPADLSAASPTPPPLELLGFAQLPVAPTAGGTPLGGLSGLAYVADRNLFLAVSDDRAEHAPARYYSLEVNLADDRLEDSGVRVRSVTNLQQPDGGLFSEGHVDPEGIAVDGQLRWISSEGNAGLGIAPFVRAYDDAGRHLAEIELPDALLPEAERGVRDNLALESLTLSPDSSWLFTASENALRQDGPAADPTRGSPSRILRVDLERRVTEAAFVYWTDRVHATPEPAGGLAVAGLVELLALDDERLLALERSFAAGVGMSIRLYLADLSMADRLAPEDEIDDLETIRPAAKRLLLDLAELDVPLDNFEGLAFGPDLADGRRTLFLVSDDNFNTAAQRSLLVALAVAPEIWKGADR